MKRLKFLPLAACLTLAALPSLWADTPGDTATTQYVTTSHGSLGLSGSVYLYDYAPAAVSGAANNFDLYAFILNLDGASADGKTGLHAQFRYRDTRLRSYYLSNVWFQELYAYRKTPWGDMHVGKFYRRVGILWDDSFFGNIQYFNGLKLDPNYGAEWVGNEALARNFSVDYSAQFFPNNGNTDGSLPGRDVNSDPLATMRNTVTLRVVPTWKWGKSDSLALGLSALNASLDRSTTTAGNFNINQLAADATLTWGPSVTYAEILRQNGELDTAQNTLGRPAYDTAVYLLAGTRWQICPRVNLRFNYSSANYVGKNAREEEYVPGAVISLTQNLSLIAEFDYWRILPRTGGQSLLDRSYNTVLRYDF